MKKPILVVMAAGMGSRYGGLKQMDPVGQNGEVIRDYSVFDARRASTSVLATSSIARAAASSRPTPRAMTSLAVSKAST